MVLAAGWWIAIVELWPASSRPYIGGSQDNSILELTLGYNGFGRLTGNETGSVGGGGGHGGGDVGRDRPPADVRLRDRRPDRAGCSRPRWSCWSPACGSPAGRAHRPGPRRAGRLGHLAARHRADLQLHGRHLPRLLHRRPGPGDRRPRRHRRAGCCGSAATSRSPRRPGHVAHGRAHHRVRLRPARPHHRLPARGCRWVVVRRRAGRRAAACVGVRHLPRTRRASVAAGAPWSPALAGPAAYAVSTAGHPAHRLDPERRPRGAGGSRRAGGGPGGPGGTRRRSGQAARAGHRWPATRGGTGGLLDGSTSSAAITALLQTDATPTPGPPRPSAPTPRPATSWPARSR